MRTSQTFNRLAAAILAIGICTTAQAAYVPHWQSCSDGQVWQYWTGGCQTPTPWGNYGHDSRRKSQ